MGRHTGDNAPPGPYQITARASQDGGDIAPYLLTEARVDSVSIGTAGKDLALSLQGLGMVSFKDVAEIR